MKVTEKLIQTFVKDQLSSNPIWAYRCLEVIYGYQTESEKACHNTCINNNIGFSGADAEIMSSFALQYQKRKFLTPKQMNILYKKAKKYWRQVLAISNKDKILEGMVKRELCTEEEVKAYKDSLMCKAFIKAL